MMREYKFRRKTINVFGVVCDPEYIKVGNYANDTLDITKERTMSLENFKKEMERKE